MAGMPGVDVANYQGQPVDWTTAAGDIGWAAVKMTELEPGLVEYVDPDAEADWEWLKANGKGRIAYLFGHPSTPATYTVNLFLDVLKQSRIGLGDGDGVALDFEVTDGLPAGQVATWAQDVLALLARETGRTPVLYTFIDFAQAGNCDGLGQYPLWIADPSRPAGQPRIPAPWTSWAIHQYAISGQVDRDVTAWPDMTAWAAAIGHRQAPAAPTVVSSQSREDNDMLIDLPTGEHVMFAPWPEVAGGQTAPYSNVSMVLSGETGAVVEVTFWRDGKTAVQTHELTSGVSVPVAPAHKWPGVTAVTLARTDTAAESTAAAVVSRW